MHILFYCILFSACLIVIVAIVASILNQMLVLYCHTVVESVEVFCQLGFRLETFT